MLDISGLFLVIALQSYGGSAPWGLEHPTVIHGEVRRGETFERELGGGLSFRLAPNSDGWRIEVGDARDDFTRCATPPFHGLTAMDIEGDIDRGPRPDGKRWFDFVLTAGDQQRLCGAVDAILYDFARSQRDDSELSTEPTEKDSITGRGWLKIAKVTGDLEAFTFDAEVALHGALTRWLIPSRFLIPTDYGSASPEMRLAQRQRLSPAGAINFACRRQGFPGRRRSCALTAAMLNMFSPTVLAFRYRVLGNACGVCGTSAKAAAAST